MTEVWVFDGEGSRLPAGVFTSRELATAWIIRHRLSGVLTRYPLDIGLFDWAVSTGAFKPKNDRQSAPSFIGQFTCAGLEHYHFEDGTEE